MSVTWLEAAAAEFDPPPDDVFARLGFTPNPGPQTAFLDLPDANIDVLFGGAVGGSKTFSLLLYALRACARYPGLQAFWFRRTFPELEHSVLRQLARIGYAQPLGCRWRADKYELRFPGGSVLTFSHAKDLKEATAFLSAEINLLLLDERTTMPPDVVDMLYTRVRTGVPGVPVLGIRSATNPGNVGHSRVVTDYIDATGHGEREITDANNRRRIFIQSRIGDTPQLGADYLKNLAGLPEKLRKAYLDGDWTVFAGQVFDEWRHARHVVRPFTPPESWKRITGTDWGFAKPWCTLWLAADEDGRVYVYRELYATQVGETEQAKRVLAVEAAEGEPAPVRYADDSMWSSRGELQSIADIYAENGCHLTPAGKGPGSRRARVQRMHTYLGEAPACRLHRAEGWKTCPRIHVFAGCTNLIRTLPTLPHPQTGDVEDVDTDAEDHAYDALTYALVNLGGGPSWPDTPPPEEGPSGGIEKLEERGQFAYRPGDDDAGERNPMQGVVQRPPWALPDQGGRMPLPGWVPPAFRRDVAEKKAKAAAIAGSPQRALPARSGFVPGIPQGGIDEHIQSVGSSAGSDRKTLLEELYDCYIAVPWAWTCIQVIARTITAGGLYTDWDADTGEGDQAPDKPPAVVALERFYSFCNPTQDIRQVLRNAIAALLVFGDALLELVWDGPTPVALYNLDVPTTYPRADEHGQVTGWVQQTDLGQAAEFEPREVIHISLDSARPGVNGIGPTQAMLTPMAAWLYAAATEKEMLRKGLPANVHVDLPASEDETRWDNRYRSRNLGTKNIGAPLISKNGGKVAELQSGKLADVIAAKAEARDEIVSGYGVPPAEAGIIEAGNLGGGTGDAQHRGFMINTCDPIAELVLEKLNFHVAVQGFGVQGWKSKFREVDYRDSTVVEQIRDTRIRNGTYTVNKGRNEISEPPVKGGDVAVIIDRQNIVLVEDLAAMSKATIASKGGAALAAAVPGQVPGQPPPGAESQAMQRAMIREALRRYHAASHAVYEDAASSVYAQMAKAFPASAISWVKDSAAWQGPQQVPLDQIATADRSEWDASREPGKVAKIRRKLRKALKKGTSPRPLVLVRWPGSDKDVIVDGHHEFLAAEQEGLHALTAYVGHVDSERGPWLTTASREKRGKKAA